jgi:CBS-domain-containing membrane protein
MPARSIERRRRLLKRGLYLLDRRFLRRPHQYLMQAVLAALTLAALVAVEDALTNAATVTAIASSAFIVFMAPHSSMAGPRRVLGGHAVGIAIGLPAFLLADEVFGGTVLAQDLVAATAVGISMLVMASTDTEHPPAAMVIVAALALSLARQLLGRWMIDLAH